MGENLDYIEIVGRGVDTFNNRRECGSLCPTTLEASPILGDNTQDGPCS